MKPFWFSEIIYFDKCKEKMDRVIHTNTSMYWLFLIVLVRQTRVLIKETKFLFWANFIKRPSDVNANRWQWKLKCNLSINLLLIMYKFSVLDLNKND